MTNGIPLRLLAAMLVVVACGRSSEDLTAASRDVALLVDESTRVAAEGRPVTTARPAVAEKCGGGRSTRVRYELVAHVPKADVDEAVSRLMKHWNSKGLYVTRLPRDKVVQASDGTYSVSAWYGAPDEATISISGTSPCGKR